MICAPKERIGRDYSSINRHLIQIEDTCISILQARKQRWRGIKSFAPVHPCWSLREPDCPSPELLFTTLQGEGRAPGSPWSRQVGGKPRQVASMRPQQMPHRLEGNINHFLGRVPFTSGPGRKVGQFLHRKQDQGLQGMQADSASEQGPVEAEYLPQRSDWAPSPVPPSLSAILSRAQCACRYLLRGLPKSPQNMCGGLHLWHSNVQRWSLQR